MAQPDKCPFCGSRKLFPAQFFSTDCVEGSVVRFPEVPQFPWWKFASMGNKDAIREVGVSKATACLGCGQLWAGFNLQQTLELVRRHGSSEMNAKLEAMDDPPH